MTTLILGAGLAGLAAAYELTRAGERVLVLEQEAEVGGMARSFQVGPYHLDLGPHRFHSRDARLNEHLFEVLEGEVVVRERRSRIHLMGRWFDYPLSLGNVVRNLPPGILARAALDYGRARLRESLHPSPDGNFEQWVEKRFGRTLYELFFGAYTAKAWRMPPSEISADWASQRISQRSLWDAFVRTLRPPQDGEARSLVTRFHYPRSGGIGSLARAYRRHVEAAGGRILTGARVRHLEHDGRRVHAVRFVTRHGESRMPCERVLNTTPLPALAAALDPRSPRELRAHAARLRHLGIVFAYVEVPQPQLTPDHWTYLPEAHLAAHRISEPKNFSDDAAPGERTAICCELTCRPGDELWNLDRDAACARVAQDLEALGLVEAERVRPLALRRLRHAYPVYDLGYREHLQALRAGLRRYENLITTGRQGLFRYNNMDHSMAMGLKAARQVLSGHDEGSANVADRAEYFG